MTRIIIVALIAVAVGATGGVMAVARSNQATPDAAADSAENLAVELAGLRADADRAEELASTLEDENSELRSQLASLKRALANQVEEAPATVELQEPLAVEDEAVADASASAEESRRGRRGGRGGWGEDMTDEERQSMREEFSQRRRDNRVGTLQAEYDKATDQATKDRISALNEQFDYMEQLRDDMRNAETDEERTALRDEMRTSWESTRGLMEQQQDTMLRDVMSKNGVTNTAQQDQLLSDLEETQSSVFFQGRGAFGGGRGGGFGGGGGRGGR